jgi:ferric-dicitrate binding protein FerR (iron transport regulator)
MEMENMRVKPVWSKSKEAIWNETFEPLDGRQTANPIVNYQLSIVNFKVWGYAAAVVLVFFLSGAFYTETKNTTRSEHAVVYLPDRSKVTLNAESTLSYKPFTWFLTRKVRLEGEACFEVQPGSHFSVGSGSNRVNVLGTTFNIYTRPGLYRVTCLSGQVEVKTADDSAILHPNMQATLRDRQFSLNSAIVPSTTTGWMQGKFDFVQTPLAEVIAEVERQYAIEVIKDYDPSLLYSGNFSKSDTPEVTLEIIGKAFGVSLRIK